MLTTITNFFLTEFIWNITVGSYYLFFSFICLVFLLKLWDHLSWFKAITLSFYFVIGAFLVFFGFVYGVLILMFDVSFVLPTDTYQGSYNHLNTGLLLAALYSSIQIIQLLLIKNYFKLNFLHMVLSILGANIISALLLYKLTFAL